jgi:RNA polymerase sigma-70 factor (ECF subfamily)
MPLWLIGKQNSPSMTILKSGKYNQVKDEDLMTAIHQGQTEAFDELYGRYRKRLLYYFYRMLGNSNEKAVDFMQDIFIKIIERPDQFDTSRKFCTWLFSVAHNMCKNEYRRLAVRKNVLLDVNMDYSRGTGNHDEENRQLAEEIFNEINELEETEKTAFILYYREDFSVRDISQVLNLPEGTVKSKLFYTRKKISDKLQLRIKE